MKQMSEKKMDMRKGSPNSEGFFPESAEMKAMPRAGDIKRFKYPDTEEMLHAQQNQFVSATSSNMPKSEFRH